MIIDTLDHLTDYIPLVPQLAEVHRILQEEDLFSKELGSYPTNDPSLFYTIMSYETINHEASTYEVHKIHADVQILLSGKEKMDIGDRKSSDIVIPYDQKKEAMFIQSPKRLSYHADPSSFVLFFPLEPHAPNLIDEEPNTVVKIVFKIRMA